MNLYTEQPKSDPSKWLLIALASVAAIRAVSYMTSWTPAERAKWRKEVADGWKNGRPVV